MSTASTHDNTVPVAGARRVLRFGSFELWPIERVLSDAGKPIPLGDRAFDLLLVMLERPGELITKEELIARTWPRRVVEEVNLRIHIAALRRALGDQRDGRRYIVNAFGRGYAFVAEVTTNSAAAVPGIGVAGRGFPLPLGRLIGRDSEVEELRFLVARSRLVTLVGTGGVGKSAIARCVLAQCASVFRDSAHFIDLTTVADARHVPRALALALGFAIGEEDPLSELSRFFRQRHLLLLLDNCEHVIEAAARVVETLLTRDSSLHVLATSREPLRVEGERRFLIKGLGVPHETARIDKRSAVDHTAIDLFGELARCAVQSFELNDTNAPLVASICRYLDGNPLAIELAAAHVGSMPLTELAARLKEQLLISPLGRHTGCAHHQTFKAALDWSYALLAEKERTALQRLAVFRGAFPLTLGIRVIAYDGISEDEATYLLFSLTDQSLVASEDGAGPPVHRLPHTTRDYALDRLQETAHASRAFRRHAEQMGHLLRKAQLDWNTVVREEWLRGYAFALEDIRYAIRWALGPSGDAALGARLAADAIPFGYRLGLAEEFRGLAREAMDALSRRGIRNPGLEERLTAAVGVLGRHFTDDSDDEALLSTARELPLSHQITFLVSETIRGIERGRYPQAASSAQRLAEWVAQNREPFALLISNRLLAQAEHFQGNQREARRLAESVLNTDVAAAPLHYYSTPIDHRVSMRIVLARVLWLEGLAEQARSMAALALEYAREDTPYSVCQVLALASCPIAAWRGDWDDAAALAAVLDEHAARYRLSRWGLFARHYANQPAEGGDDREVGGSAPEGLIGHTLLTFGRGISLPVEAALESNSWCAPELLRLQADQAVTASGSSGFDRAESALLKSLELAERQNALAWRLRTAISLASLWRQMDRLPEAMTLLSSIYALFSEGHSSADLRRAQRLLETL